MNPRLASALSWLVTVLTPIALILLGVRLLLIPGIPNLEYHMPGFPPDDYGFTLADRVKWSDYALQYLLNDAGIEYLGDLRFDDGSAVFNDRELSHMADVKRVVQGVLRTFYDALLLLLLLRLWAWRGGWARDFERGLSRGGWATVVLIAGMGAFALTDFWAFFSDFHAVFFEGDSWLFLYSDTLIRLFPLRFWQDVFAFDLGLAVILGVALGWWMRPRAGK